MRTLIAVALVLMSPILHAAPENLSGDWIMEATLRLNGSLPIYARFSLEQKGNALMGSMGPTPLAGSLGPKHRFELHYQPEKGPEIVYTGTVKNGELVGEATGNRGPLSVRAYRDTSLQTKTQSEARTHTFEPKVFHLAFSGTLAPALHISSGDTVKTSTIDAAGFDSKGAKVSQGGNPQTGPFYVEGALPGDTLAVHLLSVRLNRDTAITTHRLALHALDPGFISRMGPTTGNDNNATWRLDREKLIGSPETPSDRLKNYSVPLHPMLGCVGVAPPPMTSVRTNRLGPYGGNLDYNRIVEGTTVYLPVFQAGALLFVGDGHAAQGDGELTGNALETSLDVEFRVELIRGRSAGLPRAESADFRMASGIAGSLEESLQQATTNMVRWLQDDYKLQPPEVAAVLGTAMNYDIAEVVDGDYHVVARISKQVLSNLTTNADAN